MTQTRQSSESTKDLQVCGISELKALAVVFVYVYFVLVLVHFRSGVILSG